jgi:dTDP-4-amino-4,6-dideoxygalactose transaminase
MNPPTIEQPGATTLAFEQRETQSSETVVELGTPAVAGGRPIREGKPFLVFQAPDIREEDIAAVVDCLRSRWVGTGPRTKLFEEQFAALVEAPHAVAVNSCTAALQLAFHGLGLGPGDEVLTTDMTFCSSVSSIMHTGATPVLCDVELDSLCLDPDQLEARRTSRTRAVLVVHMAGRPCNMDAILEFAALHGLAVVEDCAHAIGAQWRGRPVGSLGDVGCFSFYATKNITTVEGGMLTLRDAVLASRIRRLALHGMSLDAWARFGPAGYSHYDVEEPGYKMNLTDLASALGLSQLARLGEIWERRRFIWEAYDAAFAELPFSLPAIPEPSTRHAYHLYTMLLDSERCGFGRDQLIAGLHAEGIGTGVHYPAISTLRYARTRLGTKPGDYPVAQYIGARTVSLPVAAWMSDEDVNDVIRAVHRLARYYAV